MNSLTQYAAALYVTTSELRLSVPHSYSTCSHKQVRAYQVFFSMGVSNVTLESTHKRWKQLYLKAGQAKKWKFLWEGSSYCSLPSVSHLIWCSKSRGLAWICVYFCTHCRFTQTPSKPRKNTSWLNRDPQARRVDEDSACSQLFSEMVHSARNSRHFSKATTGPTAMC